MRLGEHDTNIDTETNTEDIRVVRTVKYPKYDMHDGNGDLAILYLERDVEITCKRRTIYFLAPYGLNIFTNLSLYLI